MNKDIGSWMWEDFLDCYEASLNTEFWVDDWPQLAKVGFGARGFNEKGEDFFVLKGKEFLVQADPQEAIERLAEIAFHTGTRYVGEDTETVVAWLRYLMEERGAAFPAEICFRKTEEDDTLDSELHVGAYETRGKILSALLDECDLGDAFWDYVDWHAVGSRIAEETNDALLQMPMKDVTEEVRLSFIKGACPALLTICEEVREADLVKYGRMD